MSAKVDRSREVEEIRRIADGLDQDEIDRIFEEIRDERGPLSPREELEFLDFLEKVHARAIAELEDEDG